MSGTSKKTAIAIRRQKIAAAYLRGATQNEIAEEQNVDQATVSRDLKALRAEWLKSSLVDLNEAKAKELAKIDTLELEYWAAWKRSQENAEVETTKMQGGGGAKEGEAPILSRVEKQKRVEGQVGDPRYLAGIQWCIERRCAILGIDAPKKQEVTGKDGEPLTTKVIIEYADSNNNPAKVTPGTNQDQERTEEV